MNTTKIIKLDVTRNYSLALLQLTALIGCIFVVADIFLSNKQDVLIITAISDAVGFLGFFLLVIAFFGWMLRNLLAPSYTLYIQENALVFQPKKQGHKTLTVDFLNIDFVRIHSFEAFLKHRSDGHKVHVFEIHLLNGDVSSMLRKKLYRFDWSIKLYKSDHWNTEYQSFSDKSSASSEEFLIEVFKSAGLKVHRKYRNSF